MSTPAHGGHAGRLAKAVRIELHHVKKDEASGKTRPVLRDQIAQFLRERDGRFQR
jgi:hypothetical protein